MAPYYLLFVFFGLLSFLEHCKLNKSKIDFLVVISFLVLLFFYGLRYDVGIDWYSYYLFYNQVESIPSVLQGSTFAPHFYSSEFQSMEIGYRLLNSFFRTLGGSFQTFIFAIALFNLTSLYIFLFNQKIKYKFTLITIFLSLAMFREFDIFRQSISFYIFLYSLKYLNSNLKKYILINLIGSLFHLSAIIFILVIPLLKIKFSKATLMIALALYSFTLFIPLPIISGILNITETLQLFSPVMSKLLSFYTYLNYSRSFGPTISLTCIALLAIIIFNYAAYDKLNSNTRMLVNLFVCYVLLSIIGSEINEVMSRFGYYFFIGIAVMFSLLPIFLKGKLKHTIASIPIIFALMKFSLMMTTPATKITYTPYTNYIFNSSDNREKRVYIKQREVSNYYFDQINK